MGRESLEEREKERETRGVFCFFLSVFGFFLFKREKEREKRFPLLFHFFRRCPFFFFFFFVFVLFFPFFATKKKIL